MRQRRYHLIGLALTGLLLVASRAQAAPQEVVWVYPIPHALLTESPTAVLGYLLDRPADSMDIEVRDATGITRRQDLFLFKGRVFSGSVELTPGKNEVVVAGESLPLLYRPGDVSAPEDGYRPVRIHEGVTRSCSPCHGFTEGKIALQKPIPELCLSCHEDLGPLISAAPGASVHASAVTPRCPTCHDPHSGFERRLIREGPVQLCGGCHKAESAGAASHAAFAQGGCAACHESHPGGENKALRVPARELCGECHDQGKGADVEPHRPLAGDRPCTGCHDPHGSSDALLRKPAAQLCGSCHAQVSQTDHAEELAACETCHDPHASPGAGLLRTGFQAACEECHGEVLAAENRHPALEEGCQSCHDPHREDDLTKAAQACGQCHDQAADKEWLSLHGGLPIAAGRCIVCHDPHGSDQVGLLIGKPHSPLTQGECTACHPTGQDPSAPVPDLVERCRTCHADSDGETHSTHQPVADGECATCHNPHASSQRDLLRAPQGQLCRDCHDLPGSGTGETVHAAAETCTDCHDAHGAGKPPFLRAQPPELCLECHDDPRRGGMEVHPALEEGCLVCHDPHGGKGAGLLKATERSLCLECHDDPAAGSAYHHSAVDKACSGCHQPHASDKPHLLRENGTALCATCHAFTPPPQGGRHDPVADCANCHAALSHGGAVPNFLRATPPDLCLECHDDPRQGGGEEHPALEEGCLVCHDPHAGWLPGLLRGATPGAACRECHEDPASGSPVSHRPVAESCAACHEPHAGENPRLLKAVGNALCLGCHQLAGNHHSLDAARGAEKFPASADFPADGRQYACLGCHLPHGGTEPGLTRPRDELCGRCHFF